MPTAPELIDPPNWGHSALVDPEKLKSFCKFLKIILSTRVVHAKFQIFWNFFGFKVSMGNEAWIFNFDSF